ncbi:MAG: hypothetical protein KF891_12195 [Rhizobacter sp.]|nr:hypothetical protein [Rhizobacter sp.]
MLKLFHSSFSRPRRHWLRGVATLCLGLVLTACGGGGTDTDTTAPQPTPAEGRAKWTYLVYMAADNTLSDMADFNVQQMVAANSSNDVRVVVQGEQSTQYTPDASPDTLRGLVTHGQLGLASMGGNVNMADKHTLADFIKWGKQHYPADRYAVVLWSHGGGWKADKSARGALQDLGSGTGVMSVRDIAWALQEAGGVDLVNFDACLMAMYEVAYELRHAAKVMVASEEVIPGTGNPYDAVLNRLVANPTQDAAALATGIVADYDGFYRARNRDAATLSAIDLTRLDALDASVRETAALLQASLPTERLNIEAARDASAHYNYASNHDLVAFADQLSARSGNAALRAKAAELAAAARAAVLASRVFVAPGSTVGGSNGLAIYIPSADTTTADELSAYRATLSSNVAVADGKTWADFVTPLATGQSGPGQTVGSGAFAYVITWDDPSVDLDLLVNEPQGNWAGPAYGTSSVNAFSSADSYDSGERFETYTANDVLEQGAYDVFVHYAGCARGVATCGATTVSVYRIDPNAGDTEPVLLGSRLMAATPAIDVPFSPFANFIAAVESNQYGDWAYAQRTTRALPQSSKLVAAELKQLPKGLRGGVQK